MGLSVLLMGLFCHSASAQTSVSSIALEGVTNGFYIATLDRQDVFDSSVASSHISQSFTGLDGAGQTQTMTFTGNTWAQSFYGKLHCYTTGTLTNSYYNASNAPFADQNGNIINTAGSPTSLTSLGFAIFNDTLQFGGSLQSGYKARYIFHADGTNSGTGAMADLAVNVDNNPGDAFFAIGNGSFSQDWVTNAFDINGITPQTINVQFSDQVVFDTFNLTDGQDYTGTSDFSATVTLTGIEVVDANGNPVSGWTVTSGSGTVYPMLQAQTTPEPSSMLMVLAGGIPLALLGKRLQRRRKNAVSL